MGPNKEEVDKTIADISTKFVSTHDPTVSDFLGVKIDRDVQARTYTLTQPHLINSILADLGLQDNSTPRNLPALSSRILQWSGKQTAMYTMDHGTIDQSSESSIILRNARVQIKLAYAVHQCAQCAHDPKQKHT
jgi:hypothetical protein